MGVDRHIADVAPSTTIIHPEPHVFVRAISTQAAIESKGKFHFNGRRKVVQNRVKTDALQLLIAYIVCEGENRIQVGTGGVAKVVWVDGEELREISPLEGNAIGGCGIAVVTMARGGKPSDGDGIKRPQAPIKHSCEGQEVDTNGGRVIIGGSN
jgi:hypothetical protein